VSGEYPACQWYLDDVGGDSVWETECKNAFEFTNDGPQENGFKFCCYCGKALTVVLRSENAE
jgi:hypothetical protein